MELEGFKACFFQILQGWNLQIDVFISDRHLQIRKYMREVYGENRKTLENRIFHYLDVWHVAKSKKYYK